MARLNLPGAELAERELVHAGTDVTGFQSSGLLRDVGIGLRLGSSRSSFGNVLHIDLAFPLDGGDDIDSVQLLVTTKGSF